MRAFAALVRREYLEHRGPFVFGPAILIGLMLLAGLYGLVSGNVHGEVRGEMPSALRFFETILILASGGWWIYLLITLFFYCGDAFSADSRNNAMLFWKSMPQSDLKIVAAKFAAALTVFPLCVLAANALTGVIAYIPALDAPLDYAPPTLAEAVSAWLNVTGIAILYFAIGLLWYAPFFAWVGLLSTIFKRWALPLAVLIPVIAGIFETLVIRRTSLLSSDILAFLRARLQYQSETFNLETIFLSGQPFTLEAMGPHILASTDWPSLGIGLLVATVLLVAASEYRRRLVLG